MVSTNRLGQEKSPYLLQHADNPVDWYPWGDEAFEKAKEEDKPVFVSIGYATCHWCHVMAHESFEDETIAEMMNRTFVNIKVDREERPDIDNTYMLVCQMLTGSGGWPLNIFMTPDKKPFYAATYIPKRGRHSQPGMHELIPWIDDLWNNYRTKINNSSTEIAEAFRKSTQEKGGESLTKKTLDSCYQQLEESFDSNHGGFGSAPKFPSPHTLMFLLRYQMRSGKEHTLGMVEHTLTKMRQGGLFDQIGFGFHRYSTDPEWLVPHFEKMLYDQAMHTMAYTEAWLVTGNKLFQQTAQETLTYVLRDLQDEGGAFYSAEDADSEGEEGKFYVWSTDEIRKILTEDEAKQAAECFNLSEEGNYHDEASGQRTGKNILHFTKPLEQLAEEYDLSGEELISTLKKIREKLFNAREKRERPLLDDKILTDWNGLMIAALAKGGNAFDEPDYIQQAEKAVEFILTELQKDDGRLLHRYRDGEAAINAHADDYAFLIWGLLELYNATFKIPYLQQAVNLQTIFDNRFWDEKHGGYFFTAHGAEELLSRKKESYDGAIPSGNSVAMMNLLRLGRIAAKTEWEEKADQIQKVFSQSAQKAPTGFTQLLQAVGFQLGPSFEITISGPKDRHDTQEMLKKISGTFIPRAVIVLNDPNQTIKDLAPYTQNQPMKNEQATAYVCQDYSCRAPTNDPEEIIQQLTQLQEG